MGLRIAMIFCAGGVLVNFVLVPLIWFIGSHMGDVTVYPATIPISHMTAAEIYRNYVRFIGVGAIATAGLVGILKSLRVVAGSFGIALHAFRHGEAAAHGAHRPRHPHHRHTARRDRKRRSRWPSSSDNCMSPGPWWRGPGADAALLLLLHHGGRQRHCHHGQQSRLRHDPADRDRLGSGAAEVRPLRNHRHVLRDGSGRHGVRRAVRLGTIHHRPQGRLLDRLHSLGAGEGEVHRRHRRGDHRRA